MGYGTFRVSKEFVEKELNGGKWMRQTSLGMIIFDSDCFVIYDQNSTKNERVKNLLKS